MTGIEEIRKSFEESLKKFQTYQKRLYAIYERGFRIEIVR